MKSCPIAVQLTSVYPRLFRIIILLLSLQVIFIPLSGISCNGGTDSDGTDGEDCTPLTCDSQGVECGTVSDGCSGTLVCEPCNGRTEYFISPDGDDSNPGTIDEPWATLARAAEGGELQAGDVLRLRGGTYDMSDGETTTFRVTATEEMPLIITNYPGETVILEGEFESSEQRVIEIVGGAYIHIVSTGDALAPSPVPRYFRVRYGFFPISFHACTGCKVLGAEVSEAGHSGISIGASDDVEIRGIWSHDNGSDTHEHGIYPTYWAQDNKILNSLFEGNAGCGIHMNYDYTYALLECDPSVPADNEVCVDFGAPGDCLPSGQCRCAEDRDCPDLRCDSETETCVSRGGDGFLISGNILRKNGLCGVVVWDGYRDTVIENNLFINNGFDGAAAVYIGAEEERSATTGTIVRNNTIIDNGKALEAAGFSINFSAGTSIYNNIVSGRSSEPLLFVTLSQISGLSLHHNLYWHERLNSSDLLWIDADQEFDFTSWQDAGFDQNSLWGNPLFVNEPEDLHIAQDSPAVDSGTNESVPGLDFDAVSRPQSGGVDMGAYER